MTPAIPGLHLEPVAGAIPAWRAAVDAQGWSLACEAVAARGGRLAALWGSGSAIEGAATCVRALLVSHEGLICLELPVQEPDGGFPDLTDIFACAGRMQRAAHDLYGVLAVKPGGETADPRPWLRHGAWPGDAFPLRREVPAASR